MPKDTLSATGCGAEGNEDRVFKLHEFWELARGDRRVDVCCDRLQRDIPHDWRKCDRGSELFVTCIFVQRHEAGSQEGVKKYHLCLSIPINSLCAHVVPLLFVPTRCVACFLVGAQSIVQRFDSSLCPVNQLHSAFSLFHPDSFSVDSLSHGDRAHFVAWLKPSCREDRPPDSSALSHCSCHENCMDT